MIKKTITYTDYNGNERTESFYFNLNKAELIRMEMSVKGGLLETINRIIAAQDGPELFKIFEDLIQKSYGVKDTDGRGFVKKQEYLDDFMATEAYSELITELVTKEGAASDFINGVISSDLNKVVTVSPIPKT